MAVVSEAERRVREGEESLAQQRPLIDQALRLGSPWPALGLDCELRHEERQYLEAQISCERALVEIDQTDLPTDRKATARLFKLAEESRLLAARYESPPRTRAGELGGLAAADVRGFKPKAVAVPIEFPFDKTEFTEQGARAAEDLVEMITAQRVPRIHLIGHTDSVGTDAYNDRLSLARAEAVSTFMCRKASCGQGDGAILVTTEGRGKREPYQPYDPTQYTVEERAQMSRRVEFERR
jgi:OOP family OmpA-OmpF porin